MVYGLDKMVYGLPWLDKTAMKWSTGDKMVYGLPSFDKTAMGLDKRPSGAISANTAWRPTRSLSNPRESKNSESLCSIGGVEIKLSTGDKTVYGLPWLDKTAIKWSTGDKMVYGLLCSGHLGDKMVYGR